MDELALKWGKLKSWDIQSAEGVKALEKIFTVGETKENICALIDAVNCNMIYQYFYDEWMDKEAAKKYVMEYQESSH